MPNAPYFTHSENTKFSQTQSEFLQVTLLSSEKQAFFKFAPNAGLHFFPKKSAFFSKDTLLLIKSCESLTLWHPTDGQWID